MTWLPNALSLSRVPAAFLLLVTYQINPVALKLSLGLFIFVAVTDTLDGIVARRLHVASHRGYLIDGFADRTFSVACVLTASMHHNLALWVALLAITREFLLYTSRLLSPEEWHPPSLGQRLHSLVLFGATRLWFLSLMIVSLFAPADVARRGTILLNGAYAAAVVISSLVLFQALVRRIAACFEDEGS